MCCTTKCIKCQVKMMCCCGLSEGITLIGLITMVASMLVLLIACVWHNQLSSEQGLNNRPTLAADLIFSLVLIFLSVYQLILSLLLVWQSIWVCDIEKLDDGKIFLCALWYISHLSILTIYFALMAMKLAVLTMKKQFAEVLFIIVAGLCYEGIYIYFCIVVKSQIETMKCERYF